MYLTLQSFTHYNAEEYWKPWLETKMTFLSHTFVESKVKPKAHEIVVFKRKSNQMHIWRLRSNCEINFCNAFVSSLFVEKREMKFKHKTRSPIYFSSPLENLAKVFLLELYTNNKLNKQKSDCKLEIFTRSGAMYYRKCVNWLPIVWNPSIKSNIEKIGRTPLIFKVVVGLIIEKEFCRHMKNLWRKYTSPTKSTNFWHILPAVYFY